MRRRRRRRRRAVYTQEKGGENVRYMHAYTIILLNERNACSIKRYVEHSVAPVRRAGIVEGSSIRLFGKTLVEQFKLFRVNILM